MADGPNRRKVAVIGAGAAGMVSALRLSARFDVDLYEKSDRLGGHIRPLEVGGARMDTAFLGYKPEVYPALCRLLAELGIETREKAITGGVCFAQRGLRFSRLESETQAWPASIAVGRREQRAFVLMLAKALKNGCADLPNITLQQHLSDLQFPPEMVRSIIAPDVASIWGIQPEDALGMSVRGAVGSLLTVGKGVHIFPGSTTGYLDKLRERLRGVNVITEAKVSMVDPTGQGVMLLNGAVASSYHAVVFACAADQAYAMLAPPGKAMFAPLGEINYVDTVTVVHSDEAMRQPFDGDFGHFNYLEDGIAMVTWDLSALYGLAPQKVYLTAGPPALLDPALHRFEPVLDVMRHRHCVHTPASQAASEAIAQASGRGSVYFAGSYLGFAPIHEAAIASAERAAEAVPA